uniref:BZIP domain-containing protein n=1 Tax=Chrysemys picta bellii TaxID=8478 RepID=A0A8C3HVV6_CHRPI
INGTPIRTIGDLLPSLPVMEGSLPSHYQLQMAFLFALFTSAFCREAAKECRRRKKEYIKCLESRVAVLEVQNKKLIEELETLKDICSSKTD